MSGQAPPQAYDETYYQGNEQSGDRLALKWYARIAKRLARPGARVLEFGSGMGHLSKRLAERYDSSAFDLSPYARAATLQTSPTTTIVDDTSGIPDDAYDLIVSLHVLEHIPDPGATLRDFARWLRPGGRILYVVPNPQGQGHRIKKDKWFAYRDDTHCSLLPRDEWVQVTKDAGFDVEAVHADGLWDAPYVAKVPNVLQTAIAGLPGAAQVLSGRMFLPADWGECIIIQGRVRPAGH
jgi:cyclopropane fatty-acyl-phospholipid synthase-like methyltransferase